MNCTHNTGSIKFLHNLQFPFRYSLCQQTIDIDRILIYVQIQRLFRTMNLIYVWYNNFFFYCSKHNMNKRLSFSSFFPILIHIKVNLHISLTNPQVLVNFAMQSSSLLSINHNNKLKQNLRLIRRCTRCPMRSDIPRIQVPPLFTCIRHNQDTYHLYQKYMRAQPLTSGTVSAQISHISLKVSPMSEAHHLLR